MSSPPRLALACLAIACIAGGDTGLGFLSVARNRLLSGHAVALWDAVPGGMLAAMVVIPLALGGLAWAGASRAAEAAALLAASAACVVLAAAAGQGAARLAAHAPPAARVMLGAMFWLMLFAYALAAVDALQRLQGGGWLRSGVVVTIAAAVALFAASGGLAHLSLAQEYATHRDVFASALKRHLLLVAATLAIALLAGAPLGLAVQRRPRWRGPVFAALNVVQTIPSVALFGLLIAPLASLGLSGIGMVPALVALVLYALLPLVRAVVAGLDGADPATLDAARGVGMDPRQVLLRVALPLAAPALLAGLRIVTVQTIGLAVVAALIGAGGLGDFVFQGLGQYAVDLVLLGALPAIGLALAADFGLQLAAAPLRARLA